MVRSTIHISKVMKLQLHLHDFRQIACSYVAGMSCLGVHAILGGLCVNVNNEAYAYVLM